MEEEASQKAAKESHTTLELGDLFSRRHMTEEGMKTKKRECGVD